MLSLKPADEDGLRSVYYGYQEVAIATFTDRGPFLISTDPAMIEIQRFEKLFLANDPRAQAVSPEEMRIAFDEFEHNTQELRKLLPEALQFIALKNTL